MAALNPSTPEFDRLPRNVEVPFLPLEAIWPGERLDVTRHRPWAELSVGYTRFKEGDILVPKITPTFQSDRTVIARGLEGGIGAGTTELHIVRAGSGADTGYLRYLLSSKPFLDEGEASMIGVAGQKRVPDDCLRDLSVPVADVQQQRAIADYLDTETARIDALINAERRLHNIAVERLAALSQALVLGREDKDPRQNGADGILQPVPTHWIMRRNKTFLQESLDLTYTGDEELLTVSHITGVTPRAEKDVTMFLAESNVGYKRVRPMELVVNTMWAWMGALGVSDHVGIVSPAYGVYRFTDDAAIPSYFDALFRSRAYVTEMTRYSKGVWTSRLRLYPDALLALRSPFPPPREQRKIAVRLCELRQETERLSSLLERSVDLLIEHRQALITAAVTGQLDIPGVAA